MRESALMTERLSGPPSQAGGPITTEELVLEHRLRARVIEGSDVGAARRTGNTAKTIKNAGDQYRGALLTHHPSTPPEERCPLPPLADNSETSTDD